MDVSGPTNTRERRDRTRQVLADGAVRKAFLGTFRGILRLARTSNLREFKGPEKCLVVP